VAGTELERWRAPGYSACVQLGFLGAVTITRAGCSWCDGEEGDQNGDDNAHGWALPFGGRSTVGRMTPPGEAVEFTSSRASRLGWNECSISLFLNSSGFHPGKAKSPPLCPACRAAGFFRLACPKRLAGSFREGKSLCSDFD
jgi:hypothetical protein